MIKHCFYILAALSVSLPALAQNTAGLSATNSQRMRESISDYQREQQIKKFRRSYDEKKEQKSGEQPTVTSEPSADAPTVKIKKLEFDKSEVLPQSFLNNLQAEYPEGKYTLDDIKGLLEKINNYYVKNGYLTSRAYVQAQDMANGVLKISLFEGKIGDVLPQDNQYTSDAYILEALDFPQAQVLNLNDLEQKIAFLTPPMSLKPK